MFVSLLIYALFHFLDNVDSYDSIFRLALYLFRSKQRVPLITRSHTRISFFPRSSVPNGRLRKKFPRTRQVPAVIRYTFIILSALNVFQTGEMEISAQFSSHAVLQFRDHTFLLYINFWFFSRSYAGVCIFFWKPARVQFQK